MLSPNSFFRYKLLDQDEEIRNKEMDLLNLEKQHKQNKAFIGSQITELENQITVVKEALGRAISNEGSIERELQKKYDKMQIFNFYAEDPLITWLKRLLEINKEDILDLTNHNLRLINKLANTIDVYNENEDGLDEVRHQLLNLHVEDEESEDNSCTYQPPTL